MLEMPLWENDERRHYTGYRTDFVYVSFSDHMNASANGNLWVRWNYSCDENFGFSEMKSSM